MCVCASLAEVWRCLPGRRLEGQRQSVTQQGNLMNEGREWQQHTVLCRVGEMCRLRRYDKDLLCLFVF